MNQRRNPVCILGMGYVGLTLAVVMSECGFDVVGVEVNEDTIARLESGQAHFFEVGLNLRLRRQLDSGTLRFTSDHQHPDVRTSETFIITVGTPLDESGQPRMDMVERASKQVADAMPEGALVVLRSTVQLGTTRRVAKPILDATNKQYGLAYCPERTIEGKALEELRHLPQIVGGWTEDDAWRAAQVFQRVTPTTIRVTSLETAELIKLLDNSFRDLFFAFGNEVALLCEAAGLDGAEVINAANTGYARTNIALPGLVGGPCLEKDPHILAASLAEYDFQPRLVSTGRAINEDLPRAAMRSLKEDLAALDFAGAKVSVCGLAFKGRPETDDLRGTPAKYLISALREELPNAVISGQDFAVADSDIESLGVLPVDIEAAFEGASLVVIANNNAKYEWLDLDALVATMARPAIVLDMWNCVHFSADSTPEGVKLLRFGAVNNSRGGRA